MKSAIITAHSPFCASLILSNEQLSAAHRYAAPTGRGWVQLSALGRDARWGWNRARFSLLMVAVLTATVLMAVWGKSHRPDGAVLVSKIGPVARWLMFSWETAAHQHLIPSLNTSLNFSFTKFISRIIQSLLHVEEFLHRLPLNSCFWW